ncbi:MAG: hypothetical protein ABW223_11900 [Rariglobus sp.]
MAADTVAPAPQAALTSGLVQTSLALGREADAQGEVPNGRYIERRGAAGNLAGSWNMQKRLTEGKSYQITGKVRVMDATTGAPASGRVLLRFGSGTELVGTGGQTERTVFDQTIAAETEVSTFHTFSEKQPHFGVVGISIGQGLRVEFSDLAFKESTPPWAVIPQKRDKIVLVNDVAVAANSLRTGTIPIPPGATQAHVKITYGPSEILSTAAIRARLSNQGAKGFNAMRDVVAPDEAYFWRDGDDRDIWVTFKITNPRTTPGDRFRASVGGAGIAGWAGFDFEIVAGAVNKLPAKMPYHRPPYRLALPAKPTLALDMTAVEWDEQGNKDGKPVWQTHPAYTYTQPGNAETGAYLPWTAQNAPGTNVHSRQVDAEGRPYVLLHTRTLETPIDLGNNRVYPHQAAMLQGQHLNEWCHRRGVYSAQLLLPDRRGAWSAFWAVGRRGPKRTPMWPPEIDFLESFNGAYGAAYRPDTTSAGQHAGAHGSVRREIADGLELNLIELGFAKDFNFNTQIHHFTTVIEDEWVTHFRDGVEYMRHRNILDPADGNTDWDFYPIINVAVKVGKNATYEGGSGDLRWYGLQYYAPDSGYSLLPYTEKPPYPNREMLPRPKL